ncbi:membrane protein insertase YidC [Rickettsiales endosymbiont of Trichoplax sp. H2]|uniref:membrane protein insertase YidC n=1 Tax=Rickettsiales endosymbiont of Trichoplax sp. H2 TaxID=2021221 RepID=UPI0012B3A0B1|nr:membrane protein insertase YidC [Rickettsiales endosymbiont of Trichoplax sp. H2]MSO14033.1 Membrane protein insertase YidC [Rickettsiales endosymbiont of Trichoplax sp. H2]
MNNNTRTIIAAVLSITILILWQIFFQKPETIDKHNKNLEIHSDLKDMNLINNDFVHNKISISNKSKAGKIKFKNDMISGSINLVGAKIDNLILLDYKQTVQKNSKDVVLLSPTGTKNVYYAEFGWISNNKDIELPTNKSIWTSNKKHLNPNERITLSWKNSQGAEFLITILLDENYMFTIEQKILGLDNIKIKPYAAISRTINPDNQSQMLIHEGAIGVFDNKLEEIKFEDLDDKKLKFSDSDNGWFGFSDKYWLTAIIPEDSTTISTKFLGYRINEEQRYQTDAIINNDSDDNYNKIHFFAGAKKLKLLDYYQKKYNIKLFDRAVDFGVLYFITKPIFIALNYLHSLVENFGVAIILLTIFIKILLFPLAYKGFKGMNKLKDLQPEMTRLKKSCGDDSAKFQKSIVELYKKEKVNPLSGCLPILLQMPIFFALYKVLYVTLEMRHAKFYLWIKDLSAADPTNIFTFFGLIPWNTPSFFHIGVLPIIMALTLYFQQMLNPQPADPTQAKVMKFLPVIFLFMFASFPSGLVLYWSCSNILSIAQQVLIKRITK